MNIITTNAQFKDIQSWDAPWLLDGYAFLPEELDTTDFYRYNGCVDLTIENNVVTAIDPNVTAWETWKATLPSESQVLAKEIRAQRDSLLTACDWTQMEDCPLGDNAKEAWQTYRQALRDVPEQAGFPENATWPEMPE